MASKKAVVWIIEYLYTKGWFHDHLHPIHYKTRKKAYQDLAERREMLSPRMRREYRVSRYVREDK